MLAPGTKAIASAFAKDRALDTALHGLGVSAALVSASFAGYMVVVGPGGGGHHGGAPLIAAVPVPRHAVLADMPAPPSGPTVTDGIDFTPTGSIPGLDEATDRKDPVPDPNSVLTDFAVRDVFDGTALVEAHGTLQMVEAGATLEGAGEVLGIERKGSAWVVKTSGGVIRQRR